MKAQTNNLQNNLLIALFVAVTIATFAAIGLYWRRSGLTALKLIRSNTVYDTTNVHTKH